MRPIEELIAVDDPAWPLLQSWIAEAANAVEVLSAQRAAGEQTLHALQVTAHSILGALALHTGGLLVDLGWLRILGAGGARMPRDLATWNGLPGLAHRLSGAVVVADDVVGGFFAVNGGAFDGAMGHVFYLAPDTLGWEDLRMGHSDWLHWTLTGDLARFYESMRWPGWREEVAAVDTSRAVSIYPPLWAAGEPIARRSRRTVPIEELWQLHAIELPQQLAKR